MLLNKLNEDLKIALKGRDSFKTGVIRMVLASVKNKEIEKRGKGQEPVLAEEELVDLLMKEAKKRKESADIYKQGNRNDLAQKEEEEFEFIKNYLPEQLGEEEIEKIVKVAIEKTNAKEIKDIGRVMAEAMKELKGKAQPGAVSEIIKKLLTN
ncbi:MAG: GatB/YqeY domain-containing protein [Candidatus Wolfebacteria bacterium]|nr:GatB/YqeY domain-containing protein [Candidatus Wolfebacteria bacterium]